MEIKVFVLEFVRPYVRTPKGKRPHTDDVCRGEREVTAFIAVDERDADRKAEKFLAKPLVWAGKEFFAWKQALYEAPSSLEFEIYTGDRPFPDNIDT